MSERESCSSVWSARSGDPESMAFVLESFKPLIRKYGLMLGGDDGCQEMAAAVILAVRRMPEDMAEDVGDAIWWRMVSYIATSVRHSYINLSKEAKGREGTYGGPVEEWEHPASPDHSADVVSRIVIEEAKGRLTTRQRAVIGMVFDEDLSVAEAAGRLGITRQAANSLLNRGLEAMRSYLAEAAH